ncbi:uncharacterized protein LOC142163021 [Nicotiana tabacum]|uniref:Uncharacterized protein LOC142163021 n=2 Tax=Nicotiana TaxID=4085 RepID=A0AC58RUF8_TOBAC|nr:PREDICTED: uncharacterized protein LOC104228079 [Nicotiana sylvestris]
MNRQNMIPEILLTLVLLVLNLGGSNSQFMPWPPIVTRPLCLHQFTLANHACRFLPYTPLPPPSTTPSPEPQPSPPSLTSSEYEETPVEEECCRWMKSIDSECVCALLAHLPPFLSKPIHQYTAVVDASCSVTFKCSSRIRYENEKSPQSP